MIAKRLPKGGQNDSKTLQKTSSKKNTEKRGFSGNLTHKGTGSAVFSFERCFPWLPAAARVFPLLPRLPAASRGLPRFLAASRGLSRLPRFPRASRRFPQFFAAPRGVWGFSRPLVASAPRFPTRGFPWLSRGFWWLLAPSAVSRGFPRLPAAACRFPRLLAASAVSRSFPRLPAASRGFSWIPAASAISRGLSGLPLRGSPPAVSRCSPAASAASRGL